MTPTYTFVADDHADRHRNELKQQQADENARKLSEVCVRSLDLSGTGVRLSDGASAPPKIRKTFPALSK